MNLTTEARRHGGPPDLPCVDANLTEMKCKLKTSATRRGASGTPPCLRASVVNYAPGVK